MKTALDERSPRVGYILRAFPVLSETFVLNELLALRKAGVAVDIFALSAAQNGEVADPPTGAAADSVTYWQLQRAERAAVLRANLHLLLDGGPRRYWQAYRIIRDARIVGEWRAFTRLAWHARQLERSGIRHLHAHFASEAATVAWAFSLLTGLPFSFTAHAYDIFCSPFRLREKLDAAAFIVTISQYNRNHLLSVSPHLAPANVHVIHGWVSLDRFEPARRAPDGPFRILSIGRLVPKKGHLHLVEACAQLQAWGIDFQCNIAGEGPLRQQLESRMCSLGLESRVNLLGAVPHDGVPALLDAASVFVLPCVVTEDGDRDGIPVSLAEAMAMQIPVVSTTISGIPELIQEGAGFLVPPGDVGVLAQALRTVHEMDAAERAAMGGKARAVIEAEFSLDQEVARLARLFRATVAEHSEVVQGPH